MTAHYHGTVGPISELLPRATIPVAVDAPDGLGAMERLPKWLLCLPLLAQWLWLSIRYRSLTLPSLLNPGIETGGMAGESKLACLGRIPPALQGWVADAVPVAPGQEPNAVREKAGMIFPLIAKPDIGWCGYGVRRIEDAAALACYAAAFPRDATFILQQFVAAPNEAGLLYARAPGAARGALLSVTLRHQPQVTGDGATPLAGLVASQARTRPHAALYAAAAGPDGLSRAPRRGERVVLTTVASLRVGGQYQDVSAAATPALAARIEQIAQAIGDFHFGRFDVRFGTLAELWAGDFKIIEINGAGAEAIQFWDPRYALMAGFAGVFAKQRLLFEMAEIRRRQGHRPVGVPGLARAWLLQQRLIKQYPPCN